ncbi:hypothetical protein ACOSP7_012962 [Xanthoceras sorbifolium]|uniref:Tyrosyl-DNA phosphodiesterase 1 n=1 Tax=Xanthoceras sorbifolium TaxID=99658 RepID=A0ABQ8HYV0_9ROSI|nr:hypothetical protein JRO89_XS06G0177600 [Xanthoceras sorbifolium]
MSATEIGYLIPLNNDLKEDTSLPNLPLSPGPNVIGRSNVPVPDKRLSRKHLTLTAAADGSSNLVVEGTNPVIVKSGDQRKKLKSNEHLSIFDGDIIELIPGHHFFKYVTSLSQKRPSCHGGSGTQEPSTKRMRKQAEPENGIERKENCEEAIRDFRVANDKVPLTFRLLPVQGLPGWANTSCVSIGDVIQGDVLVAILSNYMVDIDWLMPACPALAKVPHVLVIHGEGDGTLEHMKRRKPANWILHKPPLPISFGTHHSKAMLLVYPRGVRIIVHTANLIYIDWNNKSQGLWMQDFPWKDQNNPSIGCGFENDLVEYLGALKWPEFNANLPALGNFKINSSFFKKFDYSSAAVRLIASVPGYHTGPNLKRWGHMKLRTVLQECTFDKEFKKSPLIYQFSSLGSLDEKWMAELSSSMSSGFADDKTPLGLGEPLIIWPTVEDVRCSLEGYAAGNAIPSPLKNVEKGFLKKYWARWKASHTGRCRAMPHIKSFTRYNGQKMAWFLLTSSNLSKAAWGALQKNNSQLMIRSYELGVLFLPAMKRHRCGFSCTNNGVPSKDQRGSMENTEVQITKLVTLTWPSSRNTDESSEVISLPVPYELPPQRYSSEDVPWSWDRRYNKKDVYGQVWPRQVQLYASQDS